ncbi:MAG: methyl-accepting chemotaxis protein [Acidobacteria bacterium]|nr:methyl-accepting chemotaxis protein [Acidobacteriota bacterium]
MRRLTLGQNILVAGALLIVTASGALGYFIAKGFSKDIAFAITEQYGNQYQRPLEKLLEALPQHQAAAMRMRKGDPNAQPDLTAAAAKIEHGLGELKQADAQWGEDLQFTAEGLAKRKRSHNKSSTLAEEWRSLKERLAQMSGEDVDKAHAHLVADVRTMIVHAGDTSNLILDPDLDSYYLMDATLVALPQTQDRLATIQAMGAELLAAPLNEDGRRRLAVAAALLKEADVDRVMADIQTALNEDPSFSGISPGLQQNLPPAAKEYARTNEALLDLLNRASAGAEPGVTGPALETAAREARQASFRLWETGATQLDGLLRLRIEALRSTRNWALALTALALLACGALSYTVVRMATGLIEQAAGQLVQHSGGISQASKQVASAANSLAVGAEQQEKALAETVASKQAILNVARGNADQSQSAVLTVESVVGRIAVANEKLNEMDASMTEISLSSAKISKVIRTIDAIAFQTNLLALNASVEAARSGAAGQGFAVVAEEVRNLAQRCAQAARETTELVSNSSTTANAGRLKLAQVAEAVRSIDESASEIRTLIRSVDEGSRQQAVSLEEVARALAQVSGHTQAAAAESEQTVAASDELDGQATDLHSVALQLRALVGGASMGVAR